MRHKILINTIDKVKEFNQICEEFNYEIVVYAGRYIIDAKSIMGLFSLDITKPIEVEIETDSSYWQETFKNSIKKFIQE